MLVYWSPPFCHREEQIKPIEKPYCLYKKKKELEFKNIFACFLPRSRNVIETKVLSIVSGGYDQ